MILLTVGHVSGAARPMPPWF